jgi:hypothetical protein
MIRSFAVALITIIFVSVLGYSREIAAWQQNPPPSQLPMQFTGATPGLNLELFLNAGKVADVTIGANGEGSSILDLSNLGKVQLQVYVDVCQDGKVVKVLVVAGKPTPEDKNCRRRIVGGAWWSDCGVTRITLDLTKFGMRVIGCGSFITSRNGLLTTGGAIVVGGLLIAGGGDSTSVTTAPPAVTTTPTTPTAPTTPVTPTPPPTNTTVTVPIDFTVTLTPGYTHPGGSTSIACFTIIATAVGNAPALNQTASYTGSITGPGVVSGGTFAGNLNASGRAVAQAVINSFGNYVGSAIVAFGGVSRQATAQVNVQLPQGSNCQ